MNVPAPLRGPLLGLGSNLLGIVLASCTLHGSTGGGATADGEDHEFEDASCAIASEGCACTAGGTCDAPLSCASSLCVNLSTTANAIPDVGTGGGGSGGRSDVGDVDNVDNGDNGGGSSGDLDAGAEDNPGGPLDTCALGSPSFDELRAQAAAAHPGVDFAARADEMTYSTAYSAFIDEGYAFQVPFWLHGLDARDLADWSAYPKAVIFDVDPDRGGVLATVVAPCERILIAYAHGGSGALAELHVTLSSPGAYTAGQARFATGADWEIPQVGGINPVPGSTPQDQSPSPDTACIICHMSNAKYYEVISSPTQTAKFSDQELIGIFTLGQMAGSPPCFRITPPDYTDLFADYHAFSTTPAQTQGLVTFLRAIAPQSQGDIVIPGSDSMPPQGTQCFGH